MFHIEYVYINDFLEVQNVCRDAKDFLSTWKYVIMVYTAILYVCKMNYTPHLLSGYGLVSCVF